MAAFRISIQIKSVTLNEVLSNYVLRSKQIAKKIFFVKEKVDGMWGLIFGSPPEDRLFHILR